MLGRAVRGLDKDLSIQNLILGHSKGGTRFNVILELLMCMTISNLEPRQELRIFPLRVRHLKGPGFGMHLPVTLPNLHMDGARISGKATRVDGAMSANDVGFIVVTGGMRTAE